MPRSIPGLGKRKTVMGHVCYLPRACSLTRLCPYLHILQMRKLQGLERRTNLSMSGSEALPLAWHGLVPMAHEAIPEAGGPFPFVLTDPVLCLSPRHPLPASLLLGSLRWAPRELHGLFGLSIWPHPTCLFTVSLSFLGTYRNHPGGSWF